jgi:uncharacterized protein YkwD
MRLFEFVYYSLISALVQIITQVYALPTEDILLEPNREQYTLWSENYVGIDSSCVEIVCRAEKLGDSTASNGMQARPPKEKVTTPLIRTEDIPFQSTPTPTNRESEQVQKTTESLEQEVKPLQENGSIAEPIVTALPAQALEQAPALPELNETIQSKVNGYRVLHGKKPLNEEATLCEAAQIRAEAASVNFSHDGFEETMKIIAFDGVAENLWQGEPFDLNIMIQSWENSSGHRENMLGDWTSGCGRHSENTVAFIFLR